ncbi:MAG TPA: nitrophenyl compound nitroreductase subunit ArsF family protein [Elusimicrobiales bacterium]|nr:nitrophenyl compound nitroreductase subunit ArsF family protein [Elusimicrobiales bacterium]
MKRSPALKAALFAFVAASIAATAYKAFAPSCGGEKPAAAAAVTQTGETAPTPTRRAAKPAATVPAVAEKTAVVYYFYTNTRCSSCKAIEKYTREAVADKLAAGYKGWKIEFRGVNVEEPVNGHYVQVYRLNSKSVVVQAFAGSKQLKWARLDKVWTLLGDKPAFVDYVAGEIRKLLDAENG